MKHLKFIKYLMLAVLGLGLVFTSCDDEEGGESKKEAVQGLYNMDAVNSGRKFFKEYNEAADYQTKIIAASPYIVTMIAKRDDKAYESSFWVGVAAEKFNLGDDLDKASTMVDQLQDIRDVWASASNEQTTAPEGSGTTE